jgi:hypothetical protein
LSITPLSFAPLQYGRCGNQAERFDGLSSRWLAGLLMARTFSAISADVTDLPSGGSLKLGSMLGGRACGRRLVGVQNVDS